MVQAMYEYDTYGNAIIREWPIGDLDRNGEVTISDEEPFAYYYLGSSNVPTDLVFADMDKDGDFDGDDGTIVRANEYQYPVELTYSGLDNPYLFTGRETDTWHAGSIYVSEDPDYQRNQWNRNRNYDPKHGRWHEVDPLGVRVDAPRGIVDPPKQYTDGMNAYEYVLSNPSLLEDPGGRQRSPEDPEDCSGNGCPDVPADGGDCIRGTRRCSSGQFGAGTPVAMTYTQSICYRPGTTCWALVYRCRPCQAACACRLCNGGTKAWMEPRDDACSWPPVLAWGVCTGRGWTGTCLTAAVPGPAPNCP